MVNDLVAADADPADARERVRHADDEHLDLLDREVEVLGGAAAALAERPEAEALVKNGDV